ncbi:MAG: hypothetical protein RBU29_15405, partial [bacterium]|nr:hypothetical protein [bacterium]
SMLKKYGFSNFGLSEPHWTMLMLLCAGGTVATVTYRSRGDAWYALAVIWGLLAILIRNLTEFSSPQVALTAAGMILVVLVMIPLGHCGSNTSQQNEPEPGNAA